MTREQWDAEREQECERLAKHLRDDRPKLNLLAIAWEAGEAPESLDWRKE